MFNFNLFVLENIFENIYITYIKCLKKIINKDLFFVILFILPPLPLPFFDNFLVSSVAGQCSARISDFSSQKPV